MISHRSDAKDAEGIFFLCVLRAFAVKTRIVMLITAIYSGITL